ncbi:MAG: Flp family type IVb pilin [Pseudomonadota bacterium]
MENQKRAFFPRNTEKGGTGVEYAILVAGIALAIYAGSMVMGKGISGKLSNAEQQIQNQSQGPAAPAAPDGGGAGGKSGGGPDNSGGNSGGDYGGGPGEAKQGSQSGK